ncbi:MAG TPA: right-handed parallel beta-helix repeat-containing protein [Polyangiaceae bacterium]|nr:right-handed parallel beta-helix repeat-containing protein [Polyangiaceae bacterium]
MKGACCRFALLLAAWGISGCGADDHHAAVNGRSDADAARAMLVSDAGAGAHGSGAEVESAVSMPPAAAEDASLASPQSQGADEPGSADQVRQDAAPDSPSPGPDPARGDSGSSAAPAPPACTDQAASDDLGVVPGELSAPFPTLEHISLQWLIDGDVNLDATVSLRFRSGQGEWRQGMPLRRVPAGDAEGFSWPNRFTGSLFGLMPATRYEIELSLTDPDGGCALETLVVSTRAKLTAAADAIQVDVTPDSFESLAADVVPGTILVMAPGEYEALRLENDGEAAAPIVVQGQPGVTIAGDVRLDERAFVIVDGLEVHGQIKMNDAHDLSITHCRVQATEDGIVTYTRAENLYIADNEVTGVTKWREEALGVDGDNVGEGILVTGPGHVIEHNRVSGFRDDISLLEDEEAVDQYSIDILYNEISEAADDGVEADFCFHDCRIVGNRLTNVFMGISSQPGLGGPLYIVRNAIYSAILSAFKLQRGSVGDVLLHNTVIKSGDALGIYTEDVFSRQYFRNNLFLGGPGGEYNGWSSGEGQVISLEAAGDAVDLDYDAFGSTLGTFSGRIADVRFSSLSELQDSTSEEHAVEIDSSVFAQALEFPSSPFPAWPIPDLRLGSDNAAIDTGLVIPNINDAYAGAAPDRGAYELGADLPDYGPR